MSNTGDRSSETTRQGTCSLCGHGWTEVDRDGEVVWRCVCGIDRPIRNQTTAVVQLKKSTGMPHHVAARKVMLATYERCRGCKSYSFTDYARGHCNHPCCRGDLGGYGRESTQWCPFYEEADKTG